MRYLATLFLISLSLLWGYFTWKYLNLENVDSLMVIILLSGIFVFGVLFGKLPSIAKKVKKQEDIKFSTIIETPTDEKEISFIPEIENINIHNSKHDSFLHFDNIEDNSFLNISNNLKKKEKQDLQIIEGIGPKIEQLLNKEGIYTYNHLEQSEISFIKLILEKAGSRYTMHNPSTWKKQAHLAYLGNIDELTKYQNKLKKGVEV